MKWSTTLFGVVLCLCALAATRVQGQTVATDANPGEFPYVVNLNLLDKAYPVTALGLVVSGRYLLTWDKAYVQGDVSKMKIIDQLGVVRTPIKIEKIVSDNFAYVKFCKIFKGAKYPMTASLFNNLSSKVSASLIFFNGTSHVLKKVAAMAFDNVTCASNEGIDDATKIICMARDTTVGFCNMLTDSAVSPTYMWNSMLAINGQVQGANFNLRCGTNGGMIGVFLFKNIDYYRSDILNELPSVDIK
ncbi:uncharacterized protein LOC135944400 [Cloeon dipterum]|uniref:uncharacterized protein LOC135944400 n=1 Tax=Cloeon dipterum TaxID=197152 RepID=UPI0032201865